MAFNYDSVKRVARICHFVGAVLLFLMSIVRFSQLNFTSTEFILCVYYIFFGVLIIFVELGFEFITSKFFFMNYSFGKALFAGFVATLCYGTSYWVQLAVAIFFTVACLGFLVMGFMFTSQEAENVKPKDPAAADANKNAPAAPATSNNQREADNMKLPAPQV